MAPPAPTAQTGDGGIGITQLLGGSDPPDPGPIPSDTPPQTTHRIAVQVKITIKPGQDVPSHFSAFQRILVNVFKAAPEMSLCSLPYLTGADAPLLNEIETMPKDINELRSRGYTTACTLLDFSHSASGVKYLLFTVGLSGPTKLKDLKLRRYMKDYLHSKRDNVGDICLTVNQCQSTGYRQCYSNHPLRRPSEVQQHGGLDR